MRFHLAVLAVVLLLSPLTSVAQQDITAQPQITDLDQLLETVREAQRQQQARNAQREERFLRDKQEQQALLSAARREFEQHKDENQPLLAVTEDNAAQIQQLQAQLHDLVGDMGDLASTFREFSVDFSAVLHDSMITAQLPERSEQLRALAAADTQPSIDEIQSLWLLLQEEMTEAARVTVFEAPVVLVDGTATRRPVLRVGPFSAFSAGDFLRYRARDPRTAGAQSATCSALPQRRAGIYSSPRRACEHYSGPFAREFVGPAKLYAQFA